MDNNIKAIIESARNREEMEVLSSDRISTGFLKVDRVTVKTDQGPLVREVLQKKNVVAVLAMTEDERVLLCAQPRAGSNQRTSIEIPAGLIDGGETPEEAAKRELLEETGYEATEMIRLALIECRRLGMDKVLMVCDKSNVASAKTIIKNGGILENEFTDEDGEINQRYWIRLD